jgi:trehalose 6-phosphate synthase/phosphatase
MRVKDGEWKYFLKEENPWKEIIRPTLSLFTQRSPGSFVEEKNHTLVWHYRNVESDLGFIRSRELLDNLHHMVRNTPLNIIDGNKVIEVRNAGVDKGTITKRLLKDGQYDFVMAIGDDKTDEDMFKVLDASAYTIKIGQGHTLAKYYLADQTEVTKLLNDLVEISEEISTLSA